MLNLASFNFKPVKDKELRNLRRTTSMASKTGNLTLMDTPGTNDPDKKRHDRQIQGEVINSIRSVLTSD